MNKFKKYFIPHNGNNHRPHFFHLESILIVILIVLFVELLSYIPVRTGVQNGDQYSASVLLSVLGGLTNEQRQVSHLSELNINPVLSEAATLKAQDMAAKGYFAHTSPEGKTPWYWLDKVKYSYDYAGENLAINFTDTADITDAWMKSPTHRANIVKAEYTEMGSGMAVGMYEGAETIFIVQVYANPKAINKVPISTKIVKELSKVDTEGSIVQDAISTTTQMAKGKILGAKVKEVNTISTVAVTTSSAVVATVFDTWQAEEAQNLWDPSFIQTIFASPRHLADRILFAMLVFVSLALFLKMVINFRVQHWDLVRNGLLVIAIIVAFFLINSYRSWQNAPTVSVVDYSAERASN